MLREEVAQKEKFKMAATLAGSIAHEIKNPLTALSTFIQYFPEKKNDPEFVAKFTNIAGKELERINDLTKDLMDFAKPSALKLVSTDINDLIQSTLSLLENDIKRRNITVDFNRSMQETKTHIDPNQIKQALLNIIMNAIQATNDGGRIIIATQTQDNFIEIRVTDTGCGMSKDELSQLFEPFYTKRIMALVLVCRLRMGLLKSIKVQFQLRVSLDKVQHSPSNFQLEVRHD